MNDIPRYLVWFSCESLERVSSSSYFFRKMSITISADVHSSFFDVLYTISPRMLRKWFYSLLKHATPVESMPIDFSEIDSMPHYGFEASVSALIPADDSFMKWVLLNRKQFINRSVNLIKYGLRRVYKNDIKELIVRDDQSFRRITSNTAWKQQLNLVSGVEQQLIEHSKLKEDLSVSDYVTWEDSMINLIASINAVQPSYTGYMISIEVIK